MLIDFPRQGWGLKVRSHTGTLLILIIVAGTSLVTSDARPTSSVTSTSTPTTGVEGTVQAFNAADELVPISGAIVEARDRSSGRLVFTTHTLPSGTFDLQVHPGDYNLTVSVSPPASNISPAFIVGRALAYVTPDLVTTVAGVNVTVRPRLAERDYGGSCLTDSAGFCNLTVWPYYPLKPFSTIVHISQGDTVSLNVRLDPSGQAEASIFYVTFSHSEYPVGPEYPLDHVLEIWPGQTHVFEGYLNTWPPIVAKVVLEGKQYTIAVNGNSTVWNLRFDPESRLFNFTIGHTFRSKGKTAEFVVSIPKSLLDGIPVVLVDNVMLSSSFSGNTSHYFVRFDYMLTQNEVTVGGSNTIPENPSLFASFLLTVVALSLYSRRRTSEDRKRLRSVVD